MFVQDLKMRWHIGLLRMRWHKLQRLGGSDEYVDGFEGLRALLLMKNFLLPDE